MRSSPSTPAPARSWWGASAARVLGWSAAPGRLGLSRDVWAVRHRWVTSVLALHLPVLVLWSWIRGVDAGTCALLTVPLALLLLARGGLRRRTPHHDLGQHLASAAGAAGLMSCACYLVAVSGGYIEAHFHFFVLVMVVALYEAWIPFAVAIGIVLVEHGVVGTVWPHAVFGHQTMHMEHPWRFAVIHAAFVLLASLVSLVTWRLAELSRIKERLLLEQMHERATHDRLTGLPNREAFVQAVRGQLRSTVEQPVAVMLIGLEGFDEISDTLGYTAGEELLRAVGDNLLGAVATVTPGATVAKLEGNQYAVLLPGHDSDRARARAEVFTEAVTATVDVVGVQVGVEASVGVTHATPRWIRALDDVADREAVLLVHQAGVALSRARDSRSGVAGFDSSIDDQVRSRLRTLSEFRRALVADDQIVLHYQPKFSFTDGRLVGVEALARWEHPTRGLLPPAQFVDLAMNTQHAEEFTRVVLDTALGQAARWRRNGFDVPVAVNVTPQCLLRPVFVPAVLELLRVHDLPPELLRLEITEDAIVQDPTAAAEVLDDLRRLGLNVSIDDFGTGFSSLSYLRHLRVDELKIDRSFVTDLVAPPQDGASPERGSEHLLVRTIISLAHGLGMTVVAEGIETQDQSDALRAAGCDIAQGFHYSRPVPAAGITSKLRDGSWTSRRSPGPGGPEVHRAPLAADLS